MRKNSFYLCFIVIFAMLFASCSKEETPDVNNSGDKAVLTLGALLTNAVNNTNKQSLPECSNSDPASADISITYDSNGDGSATDSDMTIDITVGISQDEQGFFTLYHEDLEIPIPANQNAVEVRLNDFFIYNDVPDPEITGSERTLIWMAPKEGSEYAQFVSDPLPMFFDLRAGTKNYEDVEVLCFDNREVNRFGYQFFDITPVPMIKFCMFGNVCPDGPNGRHKVASYQVDVWEYAEGTKGAQLYTDVTAEVKEDNGQMYADPTCFFLPDREGQDVYWFEITLLDVDGYYNSDDRVILQGPITDGEIKTFYDGDDALEYYHFQYGCGGDTPPPFFDPEDEAEHYSACIKALDDGDVLGYAYFTRSGNELRSTVWTVLNEANAALPQMIHANATCGSYGGVFWPLRLENGNWPMSSATGWLNYERTFSLTSTEVASLDLMDRTYVLHNSGGTPVACGEIDQID